MEPLELQNQSRSLSILPSLHGKRVTKEEYWKLYYEDEHYNYEWNQGILEEKPVPDIENIELYHWFLILIHGYLRSHPIGDLIALEMGFDVDEDHTRRPDLGFVSLDNPVPVIRDKGSYDGVCDLVIESLSTSNLKNIQHDTVLKKKEYAKGGVKEYFILDHKQFHTKFYRLNPKTRKYKEIEADEGVIKSEVLKGFAFRMEDFLKRKPPELLLRDSLYASYFFKSVYVELMKLEGEREAAKTETKEAEAKATQERKEKEEAKTRAEEAEAKVEKAEAKVEKAEAKAIQERREKEEAEAKVEEAEAKAALFFQATLERLMAKGMTEKEARNLLPN